MEEWRTCVGWNDYMVSNHGRVRRYDGTIVKGWNNEGYVYVSLTMGQRRANLSVAPLVLKAFRHPRRFGQQARHLDDVKTNNHIDNLRWGTGAQNYEDAVRNGITGYGEQNPKAKLTTAAVVDIRAKMKLPPNKRRLLKITIRSLAAQYGVSKSAIHQVLTGRTYTRT